MAIYRPPKARWPLAVAAGLAGALVGLLVGLALGSSDPDPRAVAGDIQAKLAAAAGSLEVAEIEYEEAIDGTEVTSPAEYEGALAALASSRDRYREVRPALDVLAPSLVERLDQLYEECTELMDRAAEEPEVARCTTDLEAALESGA